MSLSRSVMVASATLIVVGAALFEIRVIFRQRSQLHVLQRRSTELETQIATLRSQRDDAARELVESERQLVKLRSSPTRESSVTEARRAEVKNWLASVKHLKRLLEQRPELAIPEMQLLTNDDWLRVAKQAEVDTDDHLRKALATLRDTAKGKFSPQLAVAFTKFMNATNGQMPSTALALAIYFEKPVDVAIFQRYEMRTSDTVTDPANPYWAIRERAPVDADYDSRHQVNGNGGRVVMAARAAGWKISTE